MIIYIADRQMNICGRASTNLPRGLRVFDDMKTEDVDSGVAVFECEIPYTRKTRKKVKACAKVGNYLLRSHDNENEFYTIIDTEMDSKNQRVRIYAEDAGLDLLNGIAGKYEADKAYPVSHYIEKFAHDSGFIIGVNEISHLSRKLSWEGETTITERLASVATQFDNAEISYSFDIKRLRVENKYINIHRKRGQDKGVQLRLNKEIDRIITKESIANLCTALQVTGGTPEGKDAPITLQGYEYDDGDFYVSGSMLMSRKALAQWSRYIWNGEPAKQGSEAGHIVRTYSYDTTSQKELCAHALTNLKEKCQIEVNYEVDISRLPDNVQIGDRVSIVDDEIGQYISSRILKFATSVCNDTHSATLGDYLIRDSGISQKVEALAQQFSEIAKNRTLYTWIVYADDADGNGASLSPEGKKYIALLPNQVTSDADISDPSIFDWMKTEGQPGTPGKDGAPGEPGEKGEKGDDGSPGEAGKTTYFHIRYSSVANPSAEQMSATPAEYIGTYVDFTEADSSDPASYTWYRFRGLQGPQGDRGIPGKNGEDGNTSYLHIKYSDDGGKTLTGNKGETPGSWIGQYVDFHQLDSEDVSKYTWTKIEGASGEDGVGIRNVANRYAVSDSSTVEPTKWYNVAQVMDVANRFLWSYEVIYYTDGTSSETDKRIIGVYGDKGDTGKGIKSITEYYLASASQSGVSVNTSGWTTAVQTTSASKKYLWNYEVITYTDDTAYTSTPVIIGTNGEKGDDGNPGKDAAILSDTEPSDKTYLWCDTSVEPAVLKRWNGADWSVVNDNADQIIQLYNDVLVDIEEAKDSIMLQVGEKTYMKDEVDQLLADVNTKFEQTKNSFNFEFSNFQKSLDSLINNTDEKFNNVEKYIRFIDGSIYIGVEGNPIMLKESNDRISFLENNAEVAYISNRTLYFTHAEVLKDLKIGKFAWVYMDSGYLPLKLV